MEPYDRTDNDFNYAQSKALRTRVKTPNFKKNMRLDIVGFGVFEDLNR